MEGFDDPSCRSAVVGSDHLARCLQHETDHLDGVLFLDRMDTPRPARGHARPAGVAVGPDRVKISPHAALNPFR